MKNLLKVSVLFSLLFVAFACTKENDVTPTTNDTTLTETQLVVDELTVQGAGGSGDSTCRGPRGGKFGHGSRGRGKYDHPKGQADSITIADLPAAAQTYLTTNNLTAKVVSVFKITHTDSAGVQTITYSVRFNDRTHIHFDKDGNVIDKATRDHSFVAITLTDLPAAAQTYLSANTDVTKITHIVKITKKDGTVLYGVRSSDGKHWLFDADGNLKAKRG